MTRKLVKGIWMPESELHLTPYLSAGPFVNGKGTYQYAKLSYATQFVKRKTLAVDIGAHVGLWTYVLLTRFDKVVAFEPNAEFVDCLKLNVKDEPNEKGLTIHEIALSSMEEELDMTNGEAGHSMLSHVAAEGETPTFTVHSKPLDSFNLDPTFMKIDVEGFELQVLIGAKETIWRSRPVIIVEQKGHETRYNQPKLAARDWLVKECDYVEKHVIAGDYIMVPR